MVGSAVLRAYGDARRAMMATVWGGLVNAVLDPILIFGLDLELTGAAIASVADRATIAWFGIMPLIRAHQALAKPNAGAIHHDLMPVAAIAAPAILTQLATPLGQAFVTRSMAEFGEAAVAGMAIVGRMTPIAFGVLFALSGAIGPIIGQNHGAGREDRVRESMRDALIFTALVVVLVTLALYALRGPVVALFEADGITKDLVFLFCGPLALAFFFNGVIFVTNAAFNNLGHPFYSTWINWGRHTLGTVPLVMIGAAWCGAPGVLIGQAIGGVIFAAIALVLAYRVIVMAEPDKAETKPFAREGRLHSLFHHRR